MENRVESLTNTALIIAPQTKGSLKPLQINQYKYFIAFAALFFSFTNRSYESTKEHFISMVLNESYVKRNIVFYFLFHCINCKQQYIICWMKNLHYHCFFQLSSLKSKCIWSIEISFPFRPRLLLEEIYFMWVEINRLLDQNWNCLIQ